MITCIICGGLCNQLFQIFATIAYSIKQKNPFVFPYQEFLHGNTNRRTYWNDFLVSLKTFTVNNDKFHMTNEDLLLFSPVYCCQHHYEEISDTKNNQNVRLIGYFQSYRYFQEYENTIFSLIRLEPQMESAKAEHLHYFTQNPKIRGTTPYNVAMHFRLGDYKNIQDCHILLPYEYYRRSLEYIVDHIEATNVQILYFCEEEDNEQVLKTISSLSNYFNNRLNHQIENIVFTKVSDNIPDWKQMLLMACCDSNIIANSTFSWWGAYLNKNDKKIVCRPSVWFGPSLSHNNVEDMFHPSWIRIDS